MDRLDKILEHITDIKVVQAEQAKDLENHMSRTDYNEVRIDEMEHVYLDLKMHLHKVSGGITFAKWLAASIGFIYLLSQIYDRFM